MEKQGVRDSLIDYIASELKKDADHLDGDFIDRKIDELYALDGRSPPKLSDEALAAAARTVRSRAAWRGRNIRVKQEAQKRRFTRWAMAACFVFIFFFSVNYVTIRVTGSCLPAKVGINICCGTNYCVCDTAKPEVENQPHLK
ncbi:hypothetical protein LQZ21_08095 [Treponema sp. TIM-1]|uniref:hypothetical protein n=1 Tax=Treponema sp. TIM-1 TaxID=2898417 RepID=UPI003980989D